MRTETLVTFLLTVLPPVTRVKRASPGGLRGGRRAFVRAVNGSQSSATPVKPRRHKRFMREKRRCAPVSLRRTCFQTRLQSFANRSRGRLCVSSPLETNTRFEGCVTSASRADLRASLRQDSKHGTRWTRDSGTFSESVRLLTGKSRALLLVLRRICASCRRRRRRTRPPHAPTRPSARVHWMLAGNNRQVWRRKMAAGGGFSTLDSARGSWRGRGRAGARRAEMNGGWPWST